MKSRIVIALTVFALVSCGKKSNMMGDGGAPEYVVETIDTTSSEQLTSYPATIRGKQDIEVRPKVTGFITKLCVDEGSMVRKGQPILLIDKVEYEARANNARAAANVAKANLETQKLTLENKIELNKKEIISDYDLQMSKNKLASCEAQYAQTKAAVVDAEEQLRYCTIKSPSDGVIGNLPYRIGSLVSPSIQAPLTTVSEISEMYVYFSMTEKQLLSYNRENGDVKSMLNNFPEVELKLSDGTIYSEKGKIKTVSGLIDQATGSAQMRASFPNTQKILRSGGTGSIIIPVVYHNVIAVPQKATYEIQDKKFIYVVDKDSKVSSREIKIADQNDGKSYIVTEGLSSGERIVTEGVTTLQDNMTIKPITAAQAAKNKAEAMAKNKAQK